MKAIVQKKYGSPDDLELRDVDKPVPRDDEVLVRVRAVPIHPDVWHVVTGIPYVLRLMGAGFSKPKNPIPGTDMAGIVESVGATVTAFRPGDAVFGETIAAQQWVNGGAFAEYVSVPQHVLALKPENVTFEQAASVPTSGYITVQNLRGLDQWLAGKNVLINGAGGGATKIPVTVADDYNFWNKPESHTLAQELDFIVMHAHPMWNGILADDAFDWTRDTYRAIAAEHPDRLIVYGETGWATMKHTEGEQARLIRGRAGEAEQATFFDAVTSWAERERVTVFFFEAFDENWKGGEHPDEVEKHWGLHRADRTPKLAVRRRD